MDWNAFGAQRLSRSYYWLYLIILLYGGLVLGLIELAFSGDTARNIDYAWNAITFASAILFGISRMHDLDKSGWYVLIPIYNTIVPLFYKGNGIDNRFGPAPKELSDKHTNILKWLLIVPLVLIGLIFFAGLALGVDFTTP
ncbi:hypothetical protein A2763_00860 [Candidatus Kaiserbacteria bacterium RIFCSPHIGHO2_01_FULL_54_36]|uniref:DUF805 domain-containing protein n=1 Tax=Candidatus Kaiserbacteria bacterium RIFCSPHIGHO2_01_FULL_54_36 TaxID=1798482 RepID=A0A1F6CP66_9BACT|nr:MAG: hypothetical protein A2763_00860 [Candidatus Kaiserbacteria bacterium RIFCSPHIGHO2_01_FULL_54_36]OGG75575.1 MAG: hypothetical protein A3A41_03065 [Candidatus Kaiserbacteria bacterium RIFCSPLOWO2_01_FULL_54_22]